MITIGLILEKQNELAKFTRIRNIYLQECNRYEAKQIITVGTIEKEVFDNLLDSAAIQIESLNRKIDSLKEKIKEMEELYIETAEI